MGSHPPTGVLLLNLGGPGSLEEVEPFLISLFSDRDIIELPFGRLTQPLFARMIARWRGPPVRENYTLIGGGSPQLGITQRQAAALEARLNARWLREVDSRADGRLQRFRVFIGMRYSRPFIGDALDEMDAAGVTRIVTLPLFPHWSRATTGSARAELARVLASPNWHGHRFEITHIDSYAEDLLYLDALADTVRVARASMSPAARNRAVIVFSAHGLPRKFLDRGDPYFEQIQATRRGVVERLDGSNPHMLAFQSRTGLVKWVGPGTEQVIEELGAAGVKEVLVVPISFVSDHIETLYEIDVLFAGVAWRAGITEYRRTEALNAHPMFIEALARVVERHLDGRAASPYPTLAESLS